MTKSGDGTILSSVVVRDTDDGDVGSSVVAVGPMMMLLLLLLLG